ncbi:potassium/proton antiporter [Microlunatus panaciterrae]|uniref:Cell volume regulation protein A n=1 Tax=Microlunatus panaciterrae TaxID=400768 RepID=A0ABS2RKF1_9ACTN|nr:potassium/proton antiporter [Microlunatus panaciterrae]MBM7799143.1 cell volume regulation protein A [Microlunatus panaciterrae]
MINLDGILLVGAVVMIAAIVAARIGARIGLPSLLLFLGLGMALGDSGFGFAFNDADVARALGFGALVLILAEGGLTTRWKDIRPSVGIAGALATVGIGISVGLMTLFCHYVLGLDLWLSVLLGAVTSPTDAAAVFSVLRNVGLPHRVRGALEAESGLNDAPTVLLVVLASSAALGEPTKGGVGGLIGLIALELTLGLLIGVALGWIGVVILRSVALPSSGLYPLAALVWTVFSYAIAATLHTSGFAAVYVCALMLGNAQLPHRGATRSFVEGIGWIAQIGLFVMLGMLATPDRLTWKVALTALAAGAFLTVVARPVSVLSTASWFKVPWRHQVFLSWGGLRGAVPIVVATIPLSVNVPGATALFDVVLVFVIVFTVLQAPTLPLAARLLGLSKGEDTAELDVEVAPLERISAELLQVRVPSGSRLSGLEIGELRLPKNTLVSLIIREGNPSVPGHQDRIKAGDELLIVTPSDIRADTEDRIRALSKGGRLAKWRGQRGD